MKYEEVKELIQIFEKTDLNDMEVHLDNAAVRLNRGPVSPWSTVPQYSMPMGTPVGMPPVSNPVKPQQGDAAQVEKAGSEISSSEAEGSKVVKAPIVGTFYKSSGPDKEPYVKIGDTISEGDVVCIIEAMKFMNEVTSEVSGTVTEILVKDGQFVEFGQELLRLK